MMASSGERETNPGSDSQWRINGKYQGYTVRQTFKTQVHIFICIILTYLKTILAKKCPDSKDRTAVHCSNTIKDYVSCNNQANNWLFNPQAKCLGRLFFALSIFHSFFLCNC